MKKVFGYLLLGLAVILTLSFILTLPKLIAAFVTALGALAGKSGSYELGYSIGYFITAIVTVTIIYFAFKFGGRFIKTAPRQSQN
jgi:hypothetical protein